MHPDEIRRLRDIRANAARLCAQSRLLLDQSERALQESRQLMADADRLKAANAAANRVVLETLSQTRSVRRLT